MKMKQANQDSLSNPPNRTKTYAKITVLYFNRIHRTLKDRSLPRSSFSTQSESASKQNIHGNETEDEKHVSLTNWHRLATSEQSIQHAIQ